MAKDDDEELVEKLNQALNDFDFGKIGMEIRLVCDPMYLFQAARVAATVQCFFCQYGQDPLRPVSGPCPALALRLIFHWHPHTYDRLWLC